MPWDDAWDGQLLTRNLARVSQGFKIHWGQLRVGSSPTPGAEHSCDFLLFQEVAKAIRPIRSLRETSRVDGKMGWLPGKLRRVNPQTGRMVTPGEILRGSSRPAGAALKAP